MEKWFVSMKKADFVQIAEKYHIKNKKDTWEEVTWKSGLCP